MSTVGQPIGNYCKATSLKLLTNKSLMRPTQLSFVNADGQMLSAWMEWPASQEPHTYAIFAHCFTCGKNLNAVRNISKALAAQGFGILSFDFTGLGKSDGDFSDTTFTGNIADLVSAAIFLEKEYRAPSLLVGHSLGGAAVIQAAVELKSVNAVATIGAPADVNHVKHLFRDVFPELKDSGIAEVGIEGRPYLIKRKFIDDLEKYSITRTLSQLEKSILILHSPQDEIIEIENAALLYGSAHHPKSFISLDGADHLLTQKNDSHYAGEVIAAWAQRYLQLPPLNIPETKHQTVAAIGSKDAGYTTIIHAGSHFVTADEPEEVGGNNFGPSPYELLSSSLAACTAMTLRMYANRKNLEVQQICVHVNHTKQHSQDCEKNEHIDHFERIIELKGNLSIDQRQRLIEIANRCPVHKTLEGEIKIITHLI